MQCNHAAQRAPVIERAAIRIEPSSQKKAESSAQRQEQPFALDYNLTGSLDGQHRMHVSILSVAACKSTVK